MLLLLLRLYWSPLPSPFVNIKINLYFPSLLTHLQQASFFLQAFVAIINCVVYYDFDDFLIVFFFFFLNFNQRIWFLFIFYLFIFHYYRLYYYLLFSTITCKLWENSKDSIVRINNNNNNEKISSYIHHEIIKINTIKVCLTNNNNKKKT